MQGNGADIEWNVRSDLGVIMLVDILSAITDQQNLKTGALLFYKALVGSVVIAW